MKILMVIDTLRAGGKERRLIELIKCLKAYWIECEIIVLSKIIEYEEILSTSIIIHQLERKHKKDVGVFFKIYKIVKNYNPDVIQVWEFMSAVYATPIAKITRTKVINAVIGDAPEKLTILSKKWIGNKINFALASAIISNSAAGLRAYKAPLHKSYVFPNGFDFTRINDLSQNIEIRNKFNVYSQKIVGMVAAFSNFKDYETFILAANIVLKKHENISFICVGSGINLAHIKSLVDKKFVNKVTFCGQQGDVLSIINLFDIGVLSTFTEGVSNAIMEYMALGKPVIATKGGGTEELVLHNKTGYLIEQKNPEELAEKIIYLLNHTTKANKMGNNGRQRVKSEFGIIKMTESYIALYKEVLNISENRTKQAVC